jgi:hypothetical protein
MELGSGDLHQFKHTARGERGFRFFGVRLAIRAGVEPRDEDRFVSRRRSRITLRLRPRDYLLLAMSADARRDCNDFFGAKNNFLAIPFSRIPRPTASAANKAPGAWVSSTIRKYGSRVP